MLKFNNKYIMIGKKFNFEDTFLRDLTICLLDSLENNIKWVNRFDSGEVKVNVPFYYSLTVDERFLLDSFQDDIASTNRYLELNSDIIPRGHITLNSMNIVSDEFANPNIWLKSIIENQNEIRNILVKMRAIPIVANYDVEIRLSNEIDIFKCTQSIMDTLWLYKYMYFEYNYMNIDAIMTIPDSNNIEFNREKDLTSDNNIKIKFSIEVNTYYPAYRLDRIASSDISNTNGPEKTDLNDYKIKGGVSEYFGDSYSWPLGSDPSDSYVNIAKRSKWYDNLKKLKK